VLSEPTKLEFMRLWRRGDAARRLLNHTSSGIAVASGARGFFTPQPVAPWFQPGGTIEATSFYDTHDLKRTLEQLVDFDRLNSGAVRFSAGAVKSGLVISCISTRQCAPFGLST
jgi:hypothetical protein